MWSILVSLDFILISKCLISKWWWKQMRWWHFNIEFSYKWTITYWCKNWTKPHYILWTIINNNGSSTKLNFLGNCGLHAFNVSWPNKIANFLLLLDRRTKVMKSFQTSDMIFLNLTEFMFTAYHIVIILNFLYFFIMFSIHMA